MGYHLDDFDKKLDSIAADRESMFGHRNISLTAAGIEPMISSNDKSDTSLFPLPPNMEVLGVI